MILAVGRPRADFKANANAHARLIAAALNLSGARACPTVSNREMAREASLDASRNGACLGSSSGLFEQMRWIMVCAVVILAGCADEAPRVFGTVERDRLTLTAPVGELIASVAVVEGQAVAAGEVLLTLDGTAAAARVARQQALLREAQARLAEAMNGARPEELAKAEAALAGARAMLTEANQRYARTEQLFSTNVRPEADLEAARAYRDSSAAKATEAEQALRELRSGTRGEQIDQARSAVAAAEADLEMARKALSDLTLVAAEAAIVDTLPWQAGDRVAAGTQLVSLLATARPYVRVYLPATRLERVSPGSRVTLHVDGRPDTLPGIVRTIRSQPAYTPFYALNERDRARLVYLTDIDLSGEAASLPTGLSLEVELPLP